MSIEHSLGRGKIARRQVTPRPDCAGADENFDQCIPSFEEILKRYPEFFEQALTAKETAALIGSTPAALAQMRSRGTGPKYRRLPTTTSVDKRHRPRGPIRYLRRHAIEWLYQQRQWSNTAEEVAWASKRLTQSQKRLQRGRSDDRD